MSSVFDPSEQHGDLDAKLVAGFERLGHALRTLQRAEAQRHGLSPLQLQLLIHLRHHGRADGRVTALAERFDVRSPTISDAVNALEAKGLVERRPSPSDRRSGEVVPTSAGVSLVDHAEGWAEDVRHALSAAPVADRRASFRLVSALLATLFDRGTLSVARLCRTCRYLETAPASGAPFRCALLELDLQEESLRLDCPEHEARPDVGAAPRR